MSPSVPNETFYDLSLATMPSRSPVAPAINSTAVKPLIFATWLGAGKGVPSIKVDRSWLGSIKLAHPHAQLVVMTGEEDVITESDGVDMIFRITYDKSKMGRNSWANFYQFVAQIAFLSKLHSMGVRADVVFLDMDVVCFDTVYDMFAGPNGSPLPYDYGVCITDDASMPINIGVMTVPARSYMAACQFLEEVLALYDFDLTFTAGQVAIAQMLELWQQPETTYKLSKEALASSYTMRQVPGELQPCYSIAFFTAVKYNFCKSVTVLHYQGAPSGVRDNAGKVVDQSKAPVPRLQLSSRADLAAVRPRLVHFVGARKPAMACVFEGLLQGGPAGGYEVLAELPGLEERFAAVSSKLGAPAFDPYSESCLVWGADVRGGGSSLASTISEADLAGLMDE